MTRPSSSKHASKRDPAHKQKMAATCWILLLLSLASLVISCFSCLFRAGLRPALFLMGKVLFVCVLVWVCSCHLMLLLWSHSSPVISGFSSLLESWTSASSFFNGQGPLGLCSCLGLLLSSHASLVISCFSCHLMLLLSSRASLVISCFICHLMFSRPF